MWLVWKTTDTPQEMSAAQARAFLRAAGKSWAGPFDSRAAAETWIHGGGSGSGGGGGGSGSGGGSGGQGEDSAHSFLEWLKTKIGDPYVWGGTGPTGFDCSGLIYRGLLTLGYHGVPRTSEEQWNWVFQFHDPAQLQPGDLVFLNFPGESSPGHVMIWDGNNKVIQAPQQGQDVQYTDFNPKTSPAQWGATLVGFGRIPHMRGLGTAGVSGSGGGGGSLLSLPGGVLDMFDDAGRLAQGLMWIFQPSNWARIIAGIFGVFFAAAGIGMLTKAA